ncbi:hypothetical protein ACOZ4N_20510 (plasmid) [Halorientalis pallida]|uniref:hypothetical protein n=1 Tax=Halorientalis pallida TaxID=2479928 RepID=UPI003C6F74FE
MPRCPECYQIVSHRRLATHVEWCCSSSDRNPASDDGLQRLARRLTGVEHRIGRRIDALEAELDRLGSDSTDGHEPVGTEDLTPPST